MTDLLPDVMTSDEWKAFIGTFNTRCPTGLRNAAMFTLMHDAGLRTCEVIGLKVTDIRRDNGATALDLHVTNDRAPQYQPVVSGNHVAYVQRRASSESIMGAYWEQAPLQWAATSEDRLQFFVTPTPEGEAFHLATCQHVREAKSLHRLTHVELRANRYRPCSVCHPLSP